MSKRIFIYLRSDRGRATAASNARRVSEDAEIVMFEVVELVPS